MQGTGEGYVVDVVPGGTGERPVLPPAGHPAVDQSRVAREALVRPETEPLGDAGTVPLYQDIGSLDHPQYRGDRPRPLEVEHHRAPPAVENPVRGGHPIATRAVHAHHVGAEIGEYHPAVRHRPDPGQLDHPQPVQRSHAGHASNAGRLSFRAAPGG